VSAPTAGRPRRRPKLGPRAPAFTYFAVELSGHVASLGTEKVAEMLNVRVDDLAPMLEGRVAPPTHSLPQLRKLRNGDIP
jgi:hypothetical protein